MQDQNKDDPSQPSVNPLEKLAQPVLKGERVIQPTELILQEASAKPKPMPAVAHASPAVPRPVQEPQPLTAQDTTPTIKNEVPVGISASSLGLNAAHKAGIEWGSLLKKAIIPALLLALVGSGWLIYKNITGFSSKTIQADGFTYNVNYTKSAKQTVLKGKTYLQGTDPVSHKPILMVVGKSTHNSRDCYQGSGGQVKVIATPTIDGSQHNLCYAQGLNAYAMNFTHDGSWYFFTVFPKNNTDKIDQGTAESIANSIKIN